MPDGETEQDVHAWVDSQRRSACDMIAVFSGYQGSNPGNRYRGAGDRMVEALQQAGSDLIEAQAEWARAWNQGLIGPDPGSPPADES